VVDLQLRELRERYPGTEAQALPSGGLLVTVPGVPLPVGWTKRMTAIRFVVPAAYPYAALDCFWADVDLRLAGERMPQSAGAPNPIPETGAQGLWFSWHLAHPWNPNRDTLSSWMNTVNDRLLRPQ